MALNLVVKGGETLVPAGKEGLASLTADLLTEGTDHADVAASWPASWPRSAPRSTAAAALESCNLSLTTLTRHTAQGARALHRRPAPPGVPREGAGAAPGPAARGPAPPGRQPAGDRRPGLPQLLYGEAHPYGRPDLGTPKSVKGLTRDDVVAFYKPLFVPNNAALIVVGDTTPDAIIAGLEAALKDWKPGAPVAADPARAAGRRSR